MANWIENCIVNEKGRISALGIARFIFKIILIKVMSRKSIFVRHNNYPHNSSTQTGLWAGRIIDIAEKAFDHVITHSGHNETTNRTYIPHPLYKFPVTVRNNKKSEHPRNYFLIFGRILPYKKIETLVNVISPNVRVVIAGSAPDKAYVDYLCRLSAMKDIEIIPRYISDEEVLDIAKKSLGIVITHNDKNVIVSGTFFYALSIGVPLYTVSTPFFEWACRNLDLPQLYVEKDIQGLSELLERRLKPHPPLDIAVKELIESLFGDEVIEKKWSKIIN
ncbi:hypothetical protein [Azonexus hydrophilus]|uniref:Glycosyl transferase family 1 domain-containing protein n=1 Tax=Azonexus hydrophilus TaxID=418702 RepID=A0ABZ2XDV4_9RHOO